MTTNRIWVLGGAIVIVLVLALGGLLGVKPLLDAAQVSNDDRAAVEQLNAQQVIEIARLEGESKKLGEYQDTVAELRRAVPAIPDLDTFIGELASWQDSSGAVVTIFSVDEPALFLPSPNTAAVAVPVDGSSFVEVGFSVSVVGTRDATLAFVKLVQSGPRLVFVSDVAATEDDDGITTTTITGLVYFYLEAPFVDPTVPTAPVDETPEAAEEAQ